MHLRAVTRANPSTRAVPAALLIRITPDSAIPPLGVTVWTSMVAPRLEVSCWTDLPIPGSLVERALVLAWLALAIAGFTASRTADSARPNASLKPSSIIFLALASMADSALSAAVSPMTARMVEKAMGPPCSRPKGEAPITMPNWAPSLAAWPPIST